AVKNVAPDLVDLFQVRAHPQGHAILDKLSHPDGATTDFAGVKFADAVARKRLAQAGRKIKCVAGGVGYFNDAVAQGERDEDFLEGARISVRVALKMLDVAEKLLRICR